MNERETVVLTFPAASTALTENEWAPLERVGVVNGVPHDFSAPASTLHWKVEPARLELNENVGVGSWTTPPWAGPEVMLALGGVVTALKLLKAAKAGLGLRSFRNSPALEQKVQDAIVCRGSRQWYQKRRCTCQAARLARISRYPFLSIRAWPCIP